MKKVDALFNIWFDRDKLLWMDHWDIWVFLKFAVKQNNDRDKLLRMDNRDILVFLKLEGQQSNKRY